MWIEVIRTAAAAEPTQDGELLKGRCLNMDDGHALRLLCDYPGLFRIIPGPIKPNWDAGWEWISNLTHILDGFAEAGPAVSAYPAPIVDGISKCEDGYQQGDVALFMAGINELKAWCLSQGFMPFFCEQE